MTKLKLYLEQVRARRAAANPLWIEASEGFSPRSAHAPACVCMDGPMCRQQKVVSLRAKLDDTEKVSSHFQDDW